MKLLVLSLIISSLSCNQQNDPDIEPNLNGRWIWEKSEGGIGGWTLSHLNQNYSKSLIIDGTRYLEFINDSLVYESNFKYKKILNPLNDVYWIIDFGGFNNAAISLHNNILVLNEICDDCFSHTYIRNLKFH